MLLGTPRETLLAASALVVLFAGPGYAAPAYRPALQSPHSTAPHRVAHGASDRALTVLYDQTSNDSGYGTVSQASGGEFSSEAADDFTVSDNTVWTVKEVDVIGVYFNGSGAANADVIFYKNAHHKPGTFKAGGTFPITKDNSGSFVIKLGTNGVKLKPGHYWLSVVANMDLGSGQWYWENQTLGTTEGDPARWRNPNGGFGSNCTTWTVESKCGMGPLGDHMFTLRGKVKVKIK